MHSFPQLGSQMHVCMHTHTLTQRQKTEKESNGLSAVELYVCHNLVMILS